MYWQYLQQNRWKFYNRTNTVDFKKEDIATWTLNDLNEKIGSLFLASLKDSSILKKTSLSPYEAIITKGNARNLRPTLFDLLAHRALDYFKTGEREINKPAYSFQINDEQAFEDAAAFAAHRFISKDSQSLHHKALLIFQDLLSFHLKDKKPDALIDADLERLQFINTYSSHPEKNSLYQQALQRLIKRYEGQPATAQAIYLLAASYSEKAGNYHPFRDTLSRYAYVEAKKLCDKAIAMKGESEGKTNCKNLLKQIQKKEIATEVEIVNTTGEAFRIAVRYRNITTAYFRIIKIDKTTKEKLGSNAWEDKFWQKLTEIPSLSSFSNNFPDTRDHQPHRIEIKMDALPAGEYALLGSTDKELSVGRNALSLQYFYVSDISFVKKDQSYYVLDRKSGAPLANAKVQIWQRYYDYSKRAQSLQKTRSYTTNAEGFFESKEDTSDKKNNNNIRLEITHAKDKLFLDDDILHTPTIPF